MTCAIISTGEERLLKCKNEYEMPYPEIKAKLREKIWELYCSGCNSFFVNCEYGVPLWAAEIICAMKMYNNIELHIVMPYEEQSINWNEEYRERYYNIHSYADEVYMVGTHYYDNCYSDADRYMIDRSDILLVCGKLCDGLYGVRYAKESRVRRLYLEI